MKSYMAIKSGSKKNTGGRLIPLRMLAEDKILSNVKHPDPFINNSGNGIILRKGVREGVRGCSKTYVSL